MKKVMQSVFVLLMSLNFSFSNEMKTTSVENPELSFNENFINNAQPELKKKKKKKRTSVKKTETQKMIDNKISISEENQPVNKNKKKKK
jgi:hypothetical protein